MKRFFENAVGYVFIGLFFAVLIGALLWPVLKFFAVAKFLFG